MKHAHALTKSAKTYLAFLLLLICLIIPGTESMAQTRWSWWPFKLNRFDKDGKYHGRWKIYLGEGKDKVLIRNGRFVHGKEVGKWCYYYPDGGLYIYEEHKRYENVYTMKRYHENGYLIKEGKVIMINNGNSVRNFWFGEWRVYDAQGNFTHIEVYKDGNLIAKQ